MKFVFAQALGEIPTIPDPWDTAIDVDALGKRHYINLFLLVHISTSGIKKNNTYV